MHDKLEVIFSELGVDICNPPSVESWNIILNEVSNLLYKNDEKLEISEYNRQLAELNSAKKRDFLASMSHEIRTPLNGIISHSQLLACSELNIDQSEDAIGILTSATHLQGIVSNILDFSKIEAGKFDLDIKRISLPYLLKEVENLLSGMVLEKDILFHMEIKGEIPKVVLGDSARIKQILINLLGNAIKFTSPGGAVMLLVSSKVVGDIGEMVFSVVDTGIGISSDKQENIFEHFSQVDNSLDTHFGGTGLGLPISRELANLMGGEISFSSREKIGTVFHFSIELEIVRAGIGSFTRLESVARINFPSNFSLGAGKILVVDDNLVNRKTIARYLEKKGFEIRMASSGLEAINLLESEQFGLILMDIHMPQMSGFEVSKLIRRSGRSYQAIPILAISADVQNDTVEACQKVGINRFFAKPIDFNELILAMGAVMVSSQNQAYL